MPRVTFVEHDGTRHAVEAEAGLSVMRAAIDHDVPGIDADCGGECACATCHVIVAPEWRALIGTRGATEQAMLSQSDEPGEGSRLSCQIAVTAALDGLVVHLPASQH